MMAHQPQSLLSSRTSTIIIVSMISIVIIYGLFIFIALWLICTYFKLFGEFCWREVIKNTSEISMIC